MTYEELKKISLERADKVRFTSPVGFLAFAMPFTVDNENIRNGIVLTLSIIEGLGYEVVKKENQDVAV